jgi:hypothetical protein
MSAVHDSPQRSTDEAAMARVLAAERAAREALERCARHAAAIQEQAHARAKAIASAAARRVATVRGAMERRLAEGLARVRALEREALADSEPDRSENARLAAAIERHAEELTSEGP